MAERREQVIIEVDVDEQESVESIQSLTKANKELREERNKLNIATAEGKKRAQEINAQIDTNTSKIKENVSAIEKQKINIGNYKSALDGVHPALGKVGEGLEAGSKGFMAMARSALAFIATPIGAILAGLVAVFTLLKSALSQNDDLMDKFENITSAVGVVLEVVVARVGKLGEALIALAQGNFTEAINKTSEAFSGLADEIENAVRQQQLFLDASRDLEDDQRALNIQIARTENEIKRLVVAAKNRNLTFSEQEDLLRKALALEEQNVKAKEDIARRDLLVTARRLRADKEFQQQSSETFDQYIQRLLDSGKLAGDERDKIAEKVIALEQARGSSLAFQEKVENQLTAIQEKRAAALEKQNEALREQAAQERAVRRAQNIADTTVDDPLVGAFQTRANLIEDINDKMNKDLAKRNKEFQDEEAKRVEAAAARDILVERQKVSIIGGLTASLANLAQQDSEAHKVLATANALINTYLAATAALASGSEINPVFGIISAAAAVVNGLNSVARINGIEFAEGGYTGPGGKHEPAGIVHKDEYVVPKRVMHSQESKPHITALENMRLRGYADGGLVTSSISAPINQQMELANIVKGIPPGVLDVSEVTKVQRRIAIKEKISQR